MAGEASNPVDTSWADGFQIPDSRFPMVSRFQIPDLGLRDPLVDPIPLLHTYFCMCILLFGFTYPGLCNQLIVQQSNSRYSILLWFQKSVRKILESFRCFNLKLVPDSLYPNLFCACTTFVAEQHTSALLIRGPGRWWSCRAESMGSGSGSLSSADFRLGLNFSYWPF